MTLASDAVRVGRAEDGSGDVLVIAAWGGATGFRARVTYAPSHGGDRTSLAFSDREQVQVVVEHWLNRIDSGLTPGEEPDQTGGPPQPL